MNEVLKVENLTKKYGDKLAINEISFDIYEGECLAFVGPSGSGKTTLLRSILELTAPDSGNTLFFKRRLKNDYVNIMSIIGYLPDKPYTYPKKTIQELLDYTAKFYELDLTKEANYYLKLFNIDSHRKLDELSSGEMQKVGLILGLFHQPKLLLLDEPTNFLDAKAVNTLIDIIKRLKANKTAIIICSHQLSFVAKVANRIFTINEGSIKEINEEALKADYKKVTITLNKEVDISDFDFKGVKYLDYTNKLVTFIYQGDFNLLLKKISQISINDIDISNPTIEEIIGGLEK